MFDYAYAAKILCEFLGKDPEFEEKLKEYFENEANENIYISASFKINYQFIRFDEKKWPDIKIILKLPEDQEFISDLYIFDDGEVHFNGNIYFAKEITRFKHISDEEIINLPIKDIQLYQDIKKLEHITYVSNDFYTRGYGIDKSYIMRGDWLLKSKYQPKNISLYDYTKTYNFKIYGLDWLLKDKQNPKSILLDYTKAYNAKIYGIDRLGIKHLPETIFSKEQIKAAYDSWPNLLKMRNYIHFKNIKDNEELKARLGELIKEDDYFRNVKLIDTHENRKYVCQNLIDYNEHKDELLEILSHNVYSAKINIYPSMPGSATARLEYVNFYKMNYIIDKYIYPSPDQLIKFHINGVITNDKAILYVPSSLKHYTKGNVDFKTAPYMTIEGDDFRIIKIKVDELSSKLYSSYNNEPEEYTPNKSFIDWKTGEYKKPKKLFLQIEQRCLKNAKINYKNLTDEDFTTILQDPIKIKEYFTKNAYINYTIEKNMHESNWEEIGKVKSKQLEGNFFKYSTAAVKVVKADQNGIIDGYGIREVKTGEFIIIRNDKKDLDILTVDFAKIFSFAAHLCDEQGQILSHKPYYPGDDLPTLGGDALGEVG